MTVWWPIVATILILAGWMIWDTKGSHAMGVFSFVVVVGAVAIVWLVWAVIWIGGIWA